jgi:hypothetical protein
LRLSSEAESLQESLALQAGDTNTFITALIDFEIAPDHLSASLTIAPARVTKPITLTAPKPLNGGAAIQFGGTPRNGTLIFTELALSYTRLPLYTDKDTMADISALPEPELPGEPSLPVR